MEQARERGEDWERVGETKARAEEVKIICQDVLDLLDETLIPMTGVDNELKASYLKMKAQYSRYMCDVIPEAEKTKWRADTHNAQTTAIICSKLLPSIHPTRLAIYLEHSLFLRELGDTETAYKTAKTAFDDAIQQLNRLSEDSYKDSTLLMQKLVDNMILLEEKMREKETKEKEKRDKDRSRYVPYSG